MKYCDVKKPTTLHDGPSLSPHMTWSHHNTCWEGNNGSCTVIQTKCYFSPLRVFRLSAKWKGGASQFKWVCKICGKTIQVKRGNKTNLRDHLASYHPAIEVRLPPPPATQSRGAAHAGASRQLGVGEAFARVARYSRDSDRHKRLTGAVTQYLVEKMVPFSTVEKPAFKSLLQKFDKQYELPGKTYFSETVLPKMYNTVRASVQSELKSVDFFSACQVWIWLLTWV